MIFAGICLGRPAKLHLVVSRLDWQRHVNLEKHNRLNIGDWGSAQRRRKWNFAHRIAMQSSDSCSNRAANWILDLTSNVAARLQGRPNELHQTMTQLIVESS